MLDSSFVLDDQRKGDYFMIISSLVTVTRKMCRSPVIQITIYTVKLMIGKTLLTQNKIKCMSSLKQNVWTDEIYNE